MATDTHLLPVVIDSREQLPFSFHGRPVAVTVSPLEAGDYSVAGFERKVAVERKSLVDLVGCLGRERERFERELVRLRGWEVAAVVVEEPQVALRTGRYRGGLNPAAAWQSIVAFSSRFRVPFFWCTGREDAEATTYDILRHYARDRWRELRALRGTTEQ
jgi:ERCC4-type nuclease